MPVRPARLRFFAFPCFELLIAAAPVACGSDGSGSSPGSGASAAPGVGGTSTLVGGTAGTGGDGAPGGTGGAVTGGSGGTCTGETCEPGVPSCGDGSANAEPCRLPFIHQDGAAWVDENDQRVNLRGFNLGNWLQLEFWMMDTHMKYLGGDIEDQCTLENTLTSRFGLDEKKRLMSIYYDSWMTERDWDNIAALNVNLVRVPFMYNVIEDEANPYTVRPDGFKYLDWAIEQAERRGIYTILDLHGAVGSQGSEAHSGCAGKNELWGSDEYRSRTKWLWEQLAERYKDRSSVLGHGLLNEPWGTDAGTLADFAYELYDTVRAKAPHHVVILPGHNTGIGAYGHPNDRPNTSNVAFDVHFYPGFWGWRDGDPYVDVHSQWLHCNVPANYTNWTGQDVCEWDDRIRGLDTALLVGEFQPWASELQIDDTPSDPAISWADGLITRKTFDIYNMLGWGGTAWAYKVITREGSSGNADGGWGAVTNSLDGGGFSNIDISTASKEEIEAHFAQFATQPLITNPKILRWMNYEPKVGERIEGELFTAHQGVTMEVATDDGGGFNAANINPGDTMTYEIDVPEAGAYSLTARVASTGGGSFKLSSGATELGTVNVPNTSGWQSWQTTSPVIVELPTGKQTLLIESVSGEYNFNWFMLTAN